MSRHQDQPTLFPNERPATRDSGPVTCLGMTFENDEARRAHFTEELRKKLQDPEFRKIEGFPIGSDEDILNLSDPPYYTACPNPWIADFIAEWEAQKPEKPADYHYHREPFAADVSEGKNDPIYNAHSYHTKVPHKAIMRYILHYTEPGDIVFDGFCGTGMTGVAAQMCGDREAVMSLGYQVKPDGTILQEEADEDGKKVWKPFSELGDRKAVLNDLSPAATFIAHNYNRPVDRHEFEKTAKRIVSEVKDECGWMFETLHTDGKTIGEVKLTIWSDVLICPECTHEFVFWDVAADSESGSLKEPFKCPSCSVSLTKKKCDKAVETIYDSAISQTIIQRKQKPVKVIYTVGGKRHEKDVTENDLDIISKSQMATAKFWFPADRMMEGGETRRNDSDGITHVHHFYTKRNLIELSLLREKIFQHKTKLPALGLWFTSAHPWVTRLSRLLVSNYFKKKGGVVAPTLQGTLYVSSMYAETNAADRFELRINSCPYTGFGGDVAVLTSSTSETIIPDNSIDYLFLDPPFGANIAYSELNYLWESWLRVKTAIEAEAIENRPHNKSLTDYLNLIQKCFTECYRVLKPGRWITVEFSNTRASVWNAIQTAISDAGFVVANVSILEKSHKGFRAVTTPTAVKEDLAISAYKPNGGFEERFQKEAQTEEGVWDFVRTHLKYLPVTKRQGALLQFVPERDPRILFDQMVAYYVRKGYPVPISSQEFQIGLSQRFIERDGMYFLPEQVAEYDRKKMLSGELRQASLFVSDEATAIQWLRQLLKQKPQTFSDINPQFMQQLGGWSKNEAQLDLRELLNQNFLCYDGKGPVPEQIHAYLSSNWKELRNLAKDDPTLVAKARDRWYVPDPNKAGDLEKLRGKALLKEFEEYKAVKKKLKVFRLEAVRAGFKKAWQERDYQTIINVAEKIPNKVLEEDPKLLMWYDQAVTRMGGE